MLLEDLKRKLKQLFLTSLAFTVYGFSPLVFSKLWSRESIGFLLVPDWGGGACSGENTKDSPLGK